MQKHIFAAAFAAAALLLAVSFPQSLSAQFVGAVDTEDLAKEGPLTQSDVNFFLKYNELVTAYNKSPDEAGENKIYAFMDSSGLAPPRISIAVNKTLYTYRVVTGEMAESQLDPWFKPTDEEKRLVEENLPELKKSVGARMASSGQ
jgi:uncharacterized protein YccT (UPF0319 family)